MSVATEADQFLSVVSLAEMSYGIARLPMGARAKGLAEWLASIPSLFGERLLLVDVAVALEWGRARRRAETANKTPSVLDGLIAATARVHGLTVVTRNVRGFEAMDVPVFNPWGD